MIQRSDIKEKRKMSNHKLTLDQVYKASHLLKNVARYTDMIESNGLTEDCRLRLKAENLQLTGSFKLRGAFFKIASLPGDEREIVACSAGNHSQGVSLAAGKLKRKAVIFMPSIAPLSKVEATRKLGAEVHLVDGVYDDAYLAAEAYCKEHNSIFVHPFDDEEVIAGQGTIALEILEQFPEVDTVLVPVGGGGLVSGVAFTIKQLKPECKVYGVQAEGAPGMCKAFAEKRSVTLERVSTFADGIAVKTPGTLTRELCCKYVDGMVTVSDDEIATAILTLMEKQKLVAEGAGAAGVAAVLAKKLPLAGRNVCAVVSGGNIDVNILSRVISRGLLSTGRVADLKIAMLDKPGQLRDVSAIIADCGANVIQVRHDPGGEHADIIGCFLQIKMETRNKEQLLQIRQALKHAGYQLLD